MRFQKCPFSSRRERSKIFSSTLEFSYRFHLSTVKRSKTMKTTGTWDCTCVRVTRPSAILDRCSDLDWNRWRVTLFMSPFSPVHTRNKAFLKRSVFKSLHFCNRFSKVSVSSASSGVLVVDRRKKKFKKYAFSNKNALV